MDDDGSSAYPIENMRAQIALWYYIMRLIAISILLGILIYISIRMSISTVASEKAEYKKMLVNWATSIALVFVLHYIIILIINFNSSLVNIFSGLGGNSTGLSNAIGTLSKKCFAVSASVGVGAIVTLGILTVQTLTFLIQYIKRMLTISFLIIISPLITITYSIDMLGDQKAQALNAWLKEFFFTVIIQPFHCIIYLAFCNVAIELINRPVFNTNSYGFDSIAASVLAILCMTFIWSGEKIVKKIFGIQVSESVGDAVASAAVAGAMVSQAKKFATAGAKKGAKALVSKNIANKVGLGGGGIVGALGRTIDNKLSNGDGFVSRKYQVTKEKVHDLKEKVTTSRPIKGVKKMLDTDLGKSFKRYVGSTSVAAAAAMIGGSMGYGAGQEGSLFGAAVGAFGAYKGTKGAMDKLMNRKEERYDVQTNSDVQKVMEIRGMTGDAANLNTAEGKQNARNIAGQADIKHKYNDEDGKWDKVLDHEKEEAKDALAASTPPEVDSNKIASVLDKFDRQMEGDQPMNIGALASELGISKEKFSSAVGDYGELYMYRKMGTYNQSFDKMLDEKGYHEKVLDAMYGEESENNSSSSESETTNNTTTVNNNNNESGNLGNDNSTNEIMEKLNQIQQALLRNNSNNLGDLESQLDSIQRMLGAFDPRKIMNQKVGREFNAGGEGSITANEINRILKEADNGNISYKEAHDRINNTNPPKTQEIIEKREKYIKTVEEKHMLRRYVEVISMINKNKNSDE